MQAHGSSKIASHNADFDRVPGLTRYARLSLALKERIVANLPCPGVMLRLATRSQCSLCFSPPFDFHFPFDFPGFGPRFFRPPSSFLCENCLEVVDAKALQQLDNRLSLKLQSKPGFPRIEAISFDAERDPI
jgi:hypothetical protein